MGPETFFHASHTVLKRGEMKGLDKNGGGGGFNSEHLERMKDCKYWDGALQ